MPVPPEAPGWLLLPGRLIDPSSGLPAVGVFFTPADLQHRRQRRIAAALRDAPIAARRGTRKPRRRRRTPRP